MMILEEVIQGTPNLFQ